jgi:carbonic anhydrase
MFLSRCLAVVAGAFVVSGGFFIAGCATTAGGGNGEQTAAAEQEAMTPDAVLADLMAGNERFRRGALTRYDVKQQRQATVDGQYPKAIILSCVDSRVPVEQVFDQGIGDVFVGRVAGNVENSDQLGSMEFATEAAGAKLVMVLGHESCGAVKGAISEVRMGNLTTLLTKIEPAVAATHEYHGDERSAENHAFVSAVVRRNVEMTVADVRMRSRVLRELEEAGEIRIVGAVYSLETGEVTLLN